MNELAIIKKYTQKPVHNLGDFVHRAGTHRDNIRVGEIVKALQVGNLDKAERYSIWGYEKNPDPTSIISRLFNAVRISIHNAKFALKRFKENKKLGSDANVRSAVPVTHVIKSLGERPIIDPPRKASEFNEKYEKPLSSGRISKAYMLPTAQMSRISGAIALVNREIEREEKSNEVKNRTLSRIILKSLKEDLKNGRVKRALRQCKEQENHVMIGNCIAEAKAWRRLYNAISGN